MMGALPVLPLADLAPFTREDFVVMPLVSFACDALACDAFVVGLTALAPFVVGLTPFVHVSMTAFVHALNRLHCLRAKNQPMIVMMFFTHYSKHA